MQTYDIISIGSITLDVLMKSSQFVPHTLGGESLLCEVYGGKADVEEALLTGGGSAGNSAVSFARQGFKSTLIAEVGRDAAAQLLYDELSREKVDSRYLVEEPDEHTALSVILVAADASRSALTYRGAAHMLTSSDIDWDLVAQIPWIHIGNLGNSELVRELFVFAKSHRIKVSWNPGKSDLSDILLRSGQDFENVCDVVCINDQEYATVSQVSEKLQKIAHYLCITKGKEGGEVWQGGVRTAYSADVVQSVCEIGAGDAFVSGFVGSILRNETMQSAIDFGKKNAQSVVQFLGAKKGLLYLKPKV